MNAGILLSLEYLDAEFMKWKVKCSLNTEYSISELYTSLCILENQASISVDVLGRLWHIDKDAAMDVVSLFSSMSLATLRINRLSVECPEVAGIVLHDLQLDFCRQQAAESNTSCLWHTQLLNGYLETTHPITEEPNAQVLDAILSVTPRPWWSSYVPDDGYIHHNRSKHLACADQGFELAALLLDARWTILRSRLVVF